MKLLTDIEKSVSAPRNITIRFGGEVPKNLTAIEKKYNKKYKRSRIIAFIAGRAYSELQNSPDKKIKINKEPKDEILSLRLSADTIEQLKQLCSYYEKNTTDMIIYLINRAFTELPNTSKRSNRKSSK